MPDHGVCCKNLPLSITKQKSFTEGHVKQYSVHLVVGICTAVTNHKQAFMIP